MNVRLVILCSLFYVGAVCTSPSVAYITVWVHGTHPSKALITSKYSPLRKRMYAEHGLSLAKELPLSYDFHKIAQECCKNDPQEYQLNNFYTYGWDSSNVRPSNRKKVGRQLYNDLNQLIELYKQKYDIVNLRLVGFSHGGNVVLNCMHCLPFIDSGVDTEVILVATPIQEETRAYVNNPWVSQVYSFYSDGDWIQIIDMQKFHVSAPKNVNWFSSRKFAETDNVIQICMKVNGKFIGHLKFRSILMHLSEIMKEVKALVEKSSYVRNISFDLLVK